MDGEITPGGTSTPAPQGDQQEAPKTVPLHALQEERQKRQQIEQRLAQFESDAKKRADSELTESQRLAKRVGELEPLHAWKQSAVERLTQRRDAALEQLAPEARKRLKPLLEKFADPLDQLDALETFAASLPTESPKAPPTERGAPAAPPAGAPKTFTEWQRLPDAERRKWRDLAQTLPD
jgi:hypothetical protein